MREFAELIINIEDLNNLHASEFFANSAVNLDIGIKRLTNLGLL